MNPSALLNSTLDAHHKAAEMQPYVDKLLTAHSRGLDAEVAEQSGFGQH